jgi:ATP-dependent helicase HepA
LLLGSVELHDHQLTIVRSVSNERERRYLLADEVGLGKTVETGALIWQALNDRPTSEVLVLAPDHLRQQWVEELNDKFHIYGFSDASLRIRAHERPETWSDRPFQILVIDEAHHLTRAGPFPATVLERVAGLAHSATDLFLLSATPVRSNESAFLDLLHLLDPKNYQPDDLKSFTRRVEMRDEVALIHLSLSPELDEFDFSLFADQLRSSFPHDGTLASLVDQALVCSDDQRPDRIVRVREYLSETYRLHHRLLRTRRTPQISTTFGVRGRRRGRPFTVEIGDDSDNVRFDLIEDFRNHLAELVDAEEVKSDEAGDALRLLGEACGSLPHALLELPAADESEGGIGVVRRWLASYGDAWQRYVGAIAPVVLDEVVRQIGAMSISRDRGKVVVVSAYTTVAQVVAASLADAFWGHRVAMHVSSQSREENAASVARWRSDDRCRILVCDASAEEGLNLQTAGVVFHLDLPWAVFRLEQRLGRVDRFARGISQPVESIVFIYGEQAYAQGWFLFAADSCGVFDQSVSSLQYVLADLESEVIESAIAGGVGVFDSDIELRRQHLRGEAERIAAHDSLDSLSGVHREINDCLIREDDSQKLGAALKTWLTGVGAKVLSPARGSIQIGSSSRLQVPLPLELAIARWVGQELALSRQAAVERRVPLVRPGNELLDEIARHLRHDDRGVAFAFVRPMRNVWPPIPIFRTDFLVRAPMRQRMDISARERELISWLQIQYESLLPPVHETVYMSQLGEETEVPAVTRSYSKAMGDRNLVSREWLFGDLAAHLDWEAICGQGLVNARTILNGRDSVGPRAVRAAQALRSLIDSQLLALRARSATGLESVGERIQAFEGLRMAVPDRLEVAVDVIGCGVIILADPGVIRG